jgi:hypothetical protein
MPGADRAVVSKWALVSSLVVFAWPQLSRSVPGASTWYPLVTAVLTLLIVVIVVAWPKGDFVPDGEAAAAPTTAALPALVVTVLAATTIVIASYRWTRLLAWQPYQADMLIVIREATRRFLGGHTPYTTYRTYDAPWAIAMPYGPALWAPYIVPQLFRLDFRFVTVIGELFVPLWCGVTAIVDAARGRIAGAVGWLVLGAALVAVLDIQGFTLLGHTPAYWPLLPLLAVAVWRSRWVAAAFLLGILVLARTTMVAAIPVFLIAVWIRERRQFPLLLAVMFGTIAVGIVPFIAWDARAIWDNMVLSYPRVMKEAVWPVLARPGMETIGLTEWLVERRLETVVVPAQLLVLAGIYGAAWAAIRRGAAPLPWMALALFAFSMTTLYPVHYLYYDVLLLLVCGAMAGALASGAVRMTLSQWAVALVALTALMAVMSGAVSSPFPQIVSGDAETGRLLGSGFAMAEYDGQQRFSWIVGHDATIILPRRSAQPASIALTVQSALEDAEAPQQVTAILNGVVLGHTIVPPGWREIRFAAPRSAWWVGFNQLHLVCSSTRSPSAAGSGNDTRELALAISRVSVAPPDDRSALH